MSAGPVPTDPTVRRRPPRRRPSGPAGGVGVTWSTEAPSPGEVFVSPEDFDPTGILTGVDPCASSYWWVPELHADPGPGDVAAAPATAQPAMPFIAAGSAPRNQAARLAPSRSTTAAA